MGAVAARADSSRLLLTTLIVLTVVSGMVDAVSYLGLGHVFTANMTGNVVLLGFAAAGAKGFSAPASLTSLGSFVVGAICAGRLCLHIGSRRRWLLVAMAIEGLLTGATAVVGATAPAPVGTGWPRYTMIGILAFAMGVRNSTVRRLGVPDVTTTVLTMTLTGLAADSSLAGGDNQRSGRRVLAVVAMFVGALVGAVIYLHQGVAWPLALVALLVLATTAVFGLSPASRYLDRRDND